MQLGSLPPARPRVSATATAHSAPEWASDEAGAVPQAFGPSADQSDVAQKRHQPGRRVPQLDPVVLVRPRGDEDATVRVGYTVTKKIGNAVVRNRMKRRFRALVRETFPDNAIAGADHVLIGRSSGIERDYATLAAELKRALRKLG